MSEELMIRESAPLMTVAQLVSQRELVVSAMASAMKEGQHYGKIAGCGDKPTLLQPGAQLLGHLFRVRAEYEEVAVDLAGGHREYRVKAKFYSLGNGGPIGEGVGLCSSMESKYRFRAGNGFTDTGEPVPAIYWEMKKKDGKEATQWLVKTYEEGAGVRKIDGEWHVVITAAEKIENSNIADTFNTVLKMAKKRAYVDGIITATASSDLFTQDLEDIRENLSSVEAVATVKQAEPVKQKDADPIPMGGEWKGKLDALVEKAIKEDGIDWNMFSRAAQDDQWSKGSSWDEITEGEAKAIVGSWEKAKKIILKYKQ